MSSSVLSFRYARERFARAAVAMLAGVLTVAGALAPAGAPAQAAGGSTPDAATPVRDAVVAERLAATGDPNRPATIGDPDRLETPVTADEAGYAAREPTRVRLAGASRYETAAAVVTWRARGPIPPGPTLRLVSGTRPLDAVAYGHDAVPTLYVPPTGAVPAAVRDAYAVVRPQRIEVVGTEAQLPTRQVRAVVGERAFERRTDTDAARVTWRAATAASTWGSDDERRAMPPVALTSARVLAEAAVAVQVRPWYPVIVPGSGRMPSGTPVVPPASWWGEPVTVVGGTSTLPTSRRGTLLRGQGDLAQARFEDLAASDRYDTAMLLAYRGYRDGSRTVYIAGGVNGVDAAATVSLVDGPVVLAPPCGSMPSSTAALLRKLAPQRVVTVGDRSVICERMLDELVPTIPVWADSVAVDVALTRDAACLLDDGGGVHCWDVDDPDPLERVPWGPRLWATEPTGVARLAPGLESRMCAVMTDESLTCWGPFEDTEPQRTIISRSARIVDYQAAGSLACALGRDGRVWCHDPVRSVRPRVMASLGQARALAIGGVHACLQRVEGAIWCWDPAAATPAPTRLPVTGTPPAQIAMSDDGLLLRGNDGRVALVAVDDLRAGRATSRVVATGSSALLPRTGGCVLDRAARIDCPLEPGPVREAYASLSAGGVVTVARGSTTGCAVRRDRSVTCGLDVPDGTWAVLGDGLYAPRYRPADVLHFGRTPARKAD